MRLPGRRTASPVAIRIAPRRLRCNALLGVAHTHHRGNPLMPPPGHHCNRAALLPSPSLPAPTTHHLRHPLGSRPLAPGLALVGLVPLVSAAEIPELATLPFADCHCPRQRLASKPGCASGWRLARRQWRGNWGLVWQWPQSSGCRSIISECAPEQIPGEHPLIRQRLRARRPTLPFSGAANGNG